MFVYDYVEIQMSLEEIFLRGISLFGIIQFETGKTFGRDGKKLFYPVHAMPYIYYDISGKKCKLDIPSCKIALDPFKLKHGRYVKDKFIEFRFGNKPEELDGRIKCKLIETFGSTNDVLAAERFYYRYRINTQKSVFQYIKKFDINTLRESKNNAIKLLELDVIANGPTINSRIENELDPINNNCYTIDPIGCKDIDDAIGICSSKDNASNILTIAITNIPYYLHNLGIDNDIINEICKNLDNESILTTSVYMTNVTNMMPINFIKEVGSLFEGNNCCLCVEIRIPEEKKLEKIAWRIRPKVINVIKNLSYNEIDRDEVDQNIIKTYEKIKDTCKYLYDKIKIAKEFKPKSIENSHEVVAYCMSLMNCIGACGKLIGDEDDIKKCYNGFNCSETNLGDKLIYRCIEKDKVSDYTEEDTPLYDKISHILEGKKGRYLVKKDSMVLKDKLNIVHMTSPLRRLVDFCNIERFNQVYGISALFESGSIITDLLDEVLDDRCINFINQQNSTANKLSREASLMTYMNEVENKQKSFDGEDWMYGIVLGFEGKSTLKVYVVELGQIVTASSKYVAESISLEPLSEVKGYLIKHPKRNLISYKYIFCIVGNEIEM